MDKTKVLGRYIFQEISLTCMKFFLFKQKKCFFIKETDNFGHIVVYKFYTAYIDHFTPQHTAFEQSAACLSVYLELLPGLILFTILTRWVNFRENHFHEYKLQRSDYDI